MSTRCPACGADAEWDIHHPNEDCLAFEDDVDRAVDLARKLGLPTDRAARVVGDIAAEVPAPHRLPAVLAAVEAWAMSVKLVDEVAS